MTKMTVHHRFFPVGQGLFATGKIKFKSPNPKVPSKKFNWVYDCGSDNRTDLVSNGIEIMKRESDGQFLDLLVLSHMHRDHVNGAVELLKKVGAKTILLPWAPLWYRLLIAVQQGVSASDPVFQFYIDPVRYIQNAVPERFFRIVFVLPNDEDTPGDDLPLVVPDGEFGAGRLLKGQITAEEMLGDVGQQNIFAIKSSSRMAVSDVWEFVPYNDPLTAPKNPEGFVEEVVKLRADLLGSRIGKRKKALSALKKLYRSNFEEKIENDLSLMLFGGPIGDWESYWESCALFLYFEYQINIFSDTKVGNYKHAAVFYTGDGNLKNRTQWQNITNSISPLNALKIGILQVPHHGSRKNWYSGLAAIIDPFIGVVSSDPSYQHGHPHAEVRNDFFSRPFYGVNTAKPFEIEIRLQR